jgi:hypothetical protein
MIDQPLEPCGATGAASWGDRSETVAADEFRRGPGFVSVVFSGY